MESFFRVIVVTIVSLVWIAMFGFAARDALATGTTPSGSSASSSATASSSGGGGDSTRAYGLGSGSPSANACQRIVLFGFSVDVETCMLQQWASILGDHPSPVKLQIACRDALLEGLPICERYRKPAK